MDTWRGRTGPHGHVCRPIQLHRATRSDRSRELDPRWSACRCSARRAHGQRRDAARPCSRSSTPTQLAHTPTTTGPTAVARTHRRTLPSSYAIAYAPYCAVRELNDAGYARIRSFDAATSTPLTAFSKSPLDAPEDRLADLVAAGPVRPPASGTHHRVRSRIKPKGNLSDLVAEQRR